MPRHFKIDVQRAINVARVVYFEWIARYGALERINSNSRTQFKSALFDELCLALGVDNTKTTPFRPQANGKFKKF